MKPVSNTEYNDDLRNFQGGPADEFWKLIERSGSNVVRLPFVRARSPKPEYRGRLVIKDLSSYDVKPVAWLWNGYIAKGVQTVIHGRPEAGKGVVTASIAAAITAGSDLPDGSKASKGRVIWFSAEDSVEYALKARLIAAGADETMVTIVEAVKPKPVVGKPNNDRPFDLKSDLVELEKLIVSLGDVLLVVFDPITAYMPKVNPNAKEQVRGVLDPVTEFADRTGVAVLSIAHDVKGMGYARALARISGSSAFGEIVRTSFVVDHTDPDDKDSERRFICDKMNLPGGRPPSLGFTTMPVSLKSHGWIKTVSAEWYDEPLAIGAEEAMRETESEDGKSRKLDAAKEFLGVLLTSGPMNTLQIQAEAKVAGLSWATVRRAKDDMPIEVTKDGLRGGWFWQLSGDPPKVLTDTIL